MIGVPTEERGWRSEGARVRFCQHYSVRDKCHALGYSNRQHMAGAKEGVPIALPSLPLPLPIFESITFVAARGGPDQTRALMEGGNETHRHQVAAFMSPATPSILC